LVRATLAHAVGALRGQHPEVIAREYWPRDRHVLEYVQRGAVPPASTSGSGWADALMGTGWGSFLANLKPSAAASLIAAGQLYDLSAFAKINLPRATNNATARWVAEAAPIPVGQGAVTSIVLGPRCKLCLIFAVTREVFEHSIMSNGELAIARMLQDAAVAALDTAIFSSTASSAVNPAGVLVGITGSTASTSTDGPTAAHADIRAVTNAVVTGGGGGNILYFTSPGRKTALDSYMPQLAGRTYASAWIPDTELIALDADAFASGFDFNPEISVSMDGLLHMEDTTPAQIGTPGTPNVVAAPVTSLYQVEGVAIKMTLRAAWVLRLPAVAFISTGMTW
jgi:hypothetical protein